MTADQDSIQRLQDAKGWIFDMDGVLYRGTETLPGVQELFDELDYRGVPFRLATNNSMASPAMYVERLAGMGICADPKSILTSAMATGQYVLDTIGPRARVHVLGMPALTEQLLAKGDFVIVDPDQETPDAVIVGLDRDVTYDKLRKAHRGIQSGAQFIATNGDVTLPTEDGLVPGCGSLIAALVASTGRHPTVIGKPEVHLLEAAVADMGVARQRCIMVGDRLDTDIAAGHSSGMLTLMVLTGVSTRDEIASAPVKPDLVFTDLPAVLETLVQKESVTCD
jgi:4-nitrophenyl phosphatase